MSMAIGHGYWCGNLMECVCTVSSHIHVKRMQTSKSQKIHWVSLHVVFILVSTHFRKKNTCGVRNMSIYFSPTCHESKNSWWVFESQTPMERSKIGVLKIIWGELEPTSRKQGWRLSDWQLIRRSKIPGSKVFVLMTRSGISKRDVSRRTSRNMYLHHTTHQTTPVICLVSTCTREKQQKYLQWGKARNRKSHFAYGRNMEFSHFHFWEGAFFFECFLLLAGSALLRPIWRVIGHESSEGSP